MKAKKIVVTGGSGQIAYSLLFRIAAGDLFGPNQPVILHIRDLKEMQGALEGVSMELEDCAFPLLQEIKIGSDPAEMFSGVDAAFLVGAKPRGPGMERKDLLLENGKIFVEEGRALNESASKDVKVLVVGNPCNTNCLIAMHHAPKIPKKNFHAMLRLDQNRATALLAKKAGVRVADVKNMIIWGNHSSTQVPDFTHAKIDEKKALELLERGWLEGEFIATVQKRGAAVIAARGKSSAASAANAALDAMRSLFEKTPVGAWFTSGVTTEGNRYGLDEDLIFGLPCFADGRGGYEVVQGLSWDPFVKEKIALTVKELQEEKAGNLTRLVNILGPHNRKPLTTSCNVPLIDDLHRNPHTA